MTCKATNYNLSTNGGDKKTSPIFKLATLCIKCTLCMYVHVMYACTCCVMLYVMLCYRLAYM